MSTSVGPGDHHTYWDRFYAGRASTAVPAEPSSFARVVGADLAAGQWLVELGFGTARDALWFAREGHHVVGCDFSSAAVTNAQQRVAAEGLSAHFGMLDLYDAEACRAMAEELRSRLARPAVYARFLIHSLEHAGRHNLLDLSAHALAEGGALYLEFRTGKDAAGQHLFGNDHFRIYLDPEVVVSEIEERGGSVTRRDEGHGLAVYKSEDPHVARLVATFPRAG